MNMSRLLGVQSFVNPELLRLATSLMSSQRENQNQNQSQNQSFLLQNVEETQTQIQNQYHEPSSMQYSNNVQEIPAAACIQFSDEAAAQLMNPNVDQFGSNNNVTDLSDWQSNGAMPSTLTEDYVPLPPNYNNYYGSHHDQTVMDHHHPSSETSNFHSNNSQSFSFASVLSTPSSSPTPLNSNNSTYINGSSTEDEREISYCSNIYKFEIPDILDVNEFICN
ncbi:hypothetical protein COLO4_31602 [Corchorus olitorius]|uniref:Uncharacterized protein n=1 Tax=Corchorus olitorius TaxID=93759 RepID=A0A1R3H3Y4_9ROSI|nr:hypothetical protein COLO4_31602 [Corchorus olitorius]